MLFLFDEADIQGGLYRKYISKILTIKRLDMDQIIKYNIARKLKLKIIIFLYVKCFLIFLYYNKLHLNYRIFM